LQGYSRDDDLTIEQGFAIPLAEAKLNIEDAQSKITANIPLSLLNLIEFAS
jgi:hypothetical protein